MPDVISFFREILGVCAEFLMLEPINYFTAIFVILAIIALVKRIIL